MNNNLNEASRILKKGGIVIFPTDTAFGIGCRIDDPKAIKRLFTIRNRPLSQATPVLVDGLTMAKKYLKSVPYDVIDKLISPYWPGALTVILPCKKNLVPPLVRGGGENLGVRMPDNDVVLELIKKAGVPILGPSANFHGEATPYEFNRLSPELLKQVDYVIYGICLRKKPSTVIDCSITPWRILRKGAIEVKI